MPDAAALKATIMSRLYVEPKPVTREAIDAIVASELESYPDERRQFAAWLDANEAYLLGRLNA
jgi:hypothetical protein